MVSIAVLITVVSFSYAYIKYDTEEKDINVIGTDCIKLEMEDISEGITLQKAYPMTNANGEATNPYKFRLTNECSVGVNYQIELRVENSTDENAMPVENNIATKVDSNAKVVLSASNKVPITETQIDEKYTIGNGTLEPYKTVEHSVRIWLDESAGNETQNKIFKSKVVVEALQNQIAEKNYKEAILHGADPVLGENLIPVIIKEKDGTGTTVTVADLTEEWYDYETKKWANAVILKDSSKNPEPGTELQEDEIESYFVWIPKYSYKLFDDKLGEYESRTEKEDKSNQAIEIRFGTENTTDNGSECKTPMLENGVQGASGESGSCEKGKWMTHPAFLAFGDVKGLWVGKFETGYEGANENTFTETTENQAICKNDVNTKNASKVVIKPNSYSWKCINVANMYQNSYDYERNLDSHMMKNTEWGAVAHLTQSIYGRCSDSTHCEEVTINNNAKFITGFAGSSVSQNGVVSDPEVDSGETYNYKNSNSTKASTTGNYTGIYDMNGGSTEYVMNVMFDVNDSKAIYSKSGFTEETIPKDSKYYDKYSYNDLASNYTKRILGDATGEMGPFVDSLPLDKGSYYNDFGRFIESNYPCFHRGGVWSYTENAGIFAFGRVGGQADPNTSFRIVLAPQ